MKYKEKERQRAIAIRDSLLRDPGNGLYNGIPRDFVLSDPTLNLWDGIREDALYYFQRNKIAWHRGENNKPTGHLLSSQLACINHLYFIRQRQDAATYVLRSLQADIEEAVIVDDGFVEFEFIGKAPYMQERGRSRGANCTSVDAVMIGRKYDGQRKMFLIEWKYTEEYSSEDKYISRRADIYDPLINNELDSPFIKPVNLAAMYYEPFYQMMRQTLLGSLCAAKRDHDCTDYIHVHVIPTQNAELRNKITAPGCSGNDISEVWRNMLKNPDKYLVVTPEEILKPCENLPDCKAILSYLKCRYW